MKKGQAATGAARPHRRIAENRQARFRYELFDHWEAGLVLTGSEVKSLRAGRVTLTDAHVAVRRGEAWLIGCHIPTYTHATHDAPDPIRARKLLLRKPEIAKIERAVQQKGMTVVPVRLYFSGPHVKIEIAVGRGKKLHDKRETIKKRDQERDAQRAGHA